MPSIIGFCLMIFIFSIVFAVLPFSSLWSSTFSNGNAACVTLVLKEHHILRWYTLLSFGEVVGGERREWVKPIMFSGGIGAIEGHLIKKDKPAPGMKVWVKTCPICYNTLVLTLLTCQSHWNLDSLSSSPTVSEDWRPSVQNWCWWWGCLLYRGPGDPGILVLVVGLLPL